MDIPSGLKFTKEHEWVRDEGDGVVTVGISFYAQDALGDIVYVEVPEVGRDLEAGEEFGVVESVKAVSDVYSPVTGEVVEANEALEDSPELVNEQPFDGGWMIRVRLADPGELVGLMDVEEYEAFLRQV